MQNKKQVIQRHGFTLVEMLVAVTVLLIAVGAPLALSSQGISDATNAKSRITARFLAEDGLEYIRNIRDSNIREISNDIRNGNIPTIEWYDRFWTDSSSPSDSECKKATGCSVDVYSGTIHSCNAVTGCNPIYYDPGDKTYRQQENAPGGAIATPFTRTIRTSNPGGLGEDVRTVKVRVEWTEKGEPHKVEAETLLHNYGDL